MIKRRVLAFAVIFLFTVFFQNCSPAGDAFTFKDSTVPSLSSLEAAASTGDTAAVVSPPAETTPTPTPAPTQNTPPPSSPPPPVVPVLDPGYFTAINFQGVIAGEGHIGVDISWGTAQHPVYNPCHQYAGINDPYYGACQMADSASSPISYYKVVNYFENGTNNFPSGIFIDSANYNRCAGQPWCQTLGSIVNHGWARLVSDVGLEIYPKSSYYGGLRAHINQFGGDINGGRYSVALGKVALPNADGNVGTLNGFIKFMNQPVDSKRVDMAFFQEGGVPAVSTTGYPFYSFAATNTNDGGYYNSGILLPGRYKIYITDKGFNKTVIIRVDITSRGERLDFDLHAPCFGFSSCE